MSIEFGQCITYTAINPQGKWARCNDHLIAAGTTCRGILNSLAERFPDDIFAEIAWEVLHGIVWMDDLVDSNFDPRYRHGFVKDQAKMQPFEIFVST